MDGTPCHICRIMPQIVRLAQHCQARDKDKDNLSMPRLRRLGPIVGLVLNNIMVTSIIVNHHHHHGNHCKWLSWCWWSLWMVLAIIVNDYHGQYDLMFRIIFLSTLVAGKTLVWHFNLFNPGKKFYFFCFFICIVFSFFYLFFSSFFRLALQLVQSR